MPSFLKPVLVLILAATAVAAFLLHAPVVGAVLGALAIAALIWTALTRRPAGVRAETAGVTLTIHDRDGRRATVEKTQTLAPVRKPLTEIRDRSLFSRGRMDDFSVSPGEIGERIGLGKYHMTKVVFNPPLPPGQTVTRKLAYNIYDGFGDDDVAVMFVADYPTASAELTVNFPPERTARRSRAYIRTDRQPDRAGTLEISPDGRALRWRLADIKPGPQYHLEWTW